MSANTLFKKINLLCIFHLQILQNCNQMNKRRELINENMELFLIHINIWIPQGWGWGEGTEATVAEQEFSSII